MMKKRSAKNKTRGKPQVVCCSPMHRAMHLMLRIVYIACIYYAVYLSFQRNKGFHFTSFLLAWIFSPFYILYAWAVPVKEGFCNRLEGCRTRDVVLNVFFMICFFYALYLSLERNHGFNLVSFLMAFFFSPYYILWTLFVPPPPSSDVKFIILKPRRKNKE